MSGPWREHGMPGYRHRTQCERLLDLLQTEPSVSSLEVTNLLRIVNVTGRISDLRKKGFDVRVHRDREGVYRYRLMEQDQRSLGL